MGAAEESSGSFETPLFFSPGGRAGEALVLLLSKRPFGSVGAVCAFRLFENVKNKIV